MKLQKKLLVKEKGSRMSWHHYELALVREQRAVKAAKYFSINTRRIKFHYVSGIWLWKMHEGVLDVNFEYFSGIFKVLKSKNSKIFDKFRRPFTSSSRYKVVISCMTMIKLLNGEHLKEKNSTTGKIVSITLL